MRVCLLLFCLMLPSGIATAGKRTGTELRSAAERLDRALERKDTTALNQLLSQQLSYGHSNGWIETKDQLKANLFNGKLSYKSISRDGKEASVLIERQTGLVREEVMIEVLMDGKPLNLKLAVLQVWIFRKGDWILLGRQSTKV